MKKSELNSSTEEMDNNNSSFYLPLTCCISFAFIAGGVLREREKTWEEKGSKKK